MKDPLWWEFFSTTLQNASVSQTKHGLNSILTNYKLLPPPHKDSAFSGTEIEYINIHVVCFIWIPNLISDFPIASMLNHTINLDFGNKIYGMINMEAIPKFDIESVI